MSSSLRSKLLDVNGKVLPVFTYFRVKKLVKKWRKRAKNSKHRFFVLKEWIDTERSYINDLKIIQEDIRKPLVTAKQTVITKEQQLLMFANIDVIITLSTNMLEELEKLFKKWDPLRTQISPTLIGLHYYFRIYLEYCNQFHKGQNILKSIKGNPIVQQVEKKLKLDIASYLIKPVQRPPKYSLLLRDYQKHMPESHPDYNNLTKAIKKYHEVNEINNEAIAREARVERMFYLSKLYDQLLSSTREFVSEFNGLVYDEPVNIYVLSDMLLVTKLIDQKETLVKPMLLDQSSFVRRPPDGKYLENIVFVCGRNECLNVLFYQRKAADLVAQCISGVIEKLFKKDQQKKKLKDKVSFKRPDVKVRITLAQQRVQQLSFQPRFRISVEGVENRPLSRLRDQTYYVIKYQLSKPWRLFQYVYTKYNTAEEVEKIVRKKYPTINLIPLRSENIRGSTMEQMRNSSKMIEVRELALSQFLNYILRCDKLMTNPVSLLEKLKIDHHLWTLAVNQTKQINYEDQIKRQALNIDKYMEDRWKLVKKHGSNAPSQLFLKQTMINSARIVETSIDQFQTLQKMLLYLNALEGRMDYAMFSGGRITQSMTISVWFQNISYKEFIEVKYSESTRVGEVMLMIGKEFGMQVLDDFGLFLEYGETPRLLDQDEILHDVIEETGIEFTQIKNKGFWGGLTSIKKWGDDIIKGTKKPKLYIRKYFFLSQSLQSKACRQNPQRQLLIIEQILYDIKRNYLRLTNQQLSRISAYFVCIKEIDRIAHVKNANFPVERIKQVLPQGKRELTHNKQWMQTVIEEFQKKRLAIVSSQMKLMYVCQEVIQIAYSKPFWQFFMFPGMINKEKEKLAWNGTNVQIGVNSNHLIICDEPLATQLLRIPIMQLNYKITPYSIYISGDDKTYRFDGQMLYNLHKVIERYKLLRKLTGSSGQ